MILARHQLSHCASFAALCNAIVMVNPYIHRWLYGPMMQSLIHLLYSDKLIQFSSFEPHTPVEGGLSLSISLFLCFFFWPQICIHPTLLNSICSYLPLLFRLFCARFNLNVSTHLIVVEGIAHTLFFISIQNQHEHRFYRIFLSKPSQHNIRCIQYENVVLTLPVWQRRG